MTKRSSDTFRHFWLCSAAFAVLAGAAGAQPAPAPSDQGKVEKITVTAQRRTQNAQDVPATVNALGAKNIKSLGIDSSDKVAGYVPGVTISLPSGQGNQPILAVRGVGNNDFNTNNAGPNGVYNDEVYMSAPSAQTFQAFDLQRIEVLKGPQGTLYGRNTSGGAINFISNKPDDTFGFGATGDYGSYNTYELQGFVNAPTGDNSAARVAAIWNKSDGFMRNLLNGERVSGTDSVAGRVLWNVEPTENLSLLFNVHGAKVDTLPTEYHRVGTLDGTLTQCSQTDIQANLCNDLFFNPTIADLYKGSYNRTQHLDVENEGLSITANYNLGGMTLTSITAYEHNDKLHPEDSDAGPLNLLQLDFGVRSNTFTQEFRLAGESEKLNWVAGLYYLGETLKQDQSIDIFHDLDIAFGPGTGECIPANLTLFTQFCSQTGTAHSKQETTAYAAFGQADFEVFQNTRLTLGGRYTNESKDFTLDGTIIGQFGGYEVFTAPQTLWSGGFDESLDKSAFSWKVALDHHFTDKIMAYASFSTGFKSGGFNGGFLDINEPTAAGQVAPVRSESNKAYEIGLKSELFDDRLRFNVSAFYYDYKDLQVHVLTTPPGGLTADVLDNAQKSTIKGVDVEAIAKPFENFTARLSAEWLDAKLDEYLSSRGPAAQNYSGNTLSNAPEFSFTGVAEYTIPLGDGDNIDFVGAASYRSKVFFDPANDPLIVQEGYWVLDARAAYVLDDGRWEFAVFGRNLGDEKYLNMAFDLASFGLLQQIVAPPRTIGIEASFRY